MMAFAIAYSLITQGGDAFVLSLNNGINKAFELFITLAPIMCFWTGIMEIAQRSNMTKYISKCLYPLTKILFGPTSKRRDVMDKISMNMSANILGMGNAATPSGLAAMESLDSINPEPFSATDAMCMFIIINTASIQLIPTSVIALRSQYGSASPSDILLPTIITTICAFLVGTVSAKICSRLPLFR